MRRFASERRGLGGFAACLCVAACSSRRAAPPLAVAVAPPPLLVLASPPPAPPSPPEAIAAVVGTVHAGRLRSLLANSSSRSASAHRQFWGWLLEKGEEVRFRVEWRGGGGVDWVVEAGAPVPHFAGIECRPRRLFGRARCAPSEQSSLGERSRPWAAPQLPPGVLGAVELQTALSGDLQAELETWVSARLRGALGRNTLFNSAAEDALALLATAIAQPLDRALWTLDGSHAYFTADRSAGIRVDATLGLRAAEVLVPYARQAPPASLWGLPRHTSSAVFGPPSESLAQVAGAAGELLSALFRFRGLDRRVAARVGRWVGRAPTRWLSHAQGSLPLGGARPEFQLLTVRGDWLEAVAWLDEGVALLADPAVALQAQRLVASLLGRRSSGLGFDARPAARGARLYEGSLQPLGEAESRLRLLLHVSAGPRQSSASGAQPSSRWVFAHEGKVIDWFAHAPPRLTQTLAARAGLESLTRARGFTWGFVTPGGAHPPGAPATVCAWNTARTANVTVQVPPSAVQTWFAENFLGAWMGDASAPAAPATTGSGR